MHNLPRWPSLGSQSGLGNVQIDLFDEAVELLNTHTVERLEGQLIVKENALKEKENENEMLKLELKKKQAEMGKSWTLVLYMMKVMSSKEDDDGQILSAELRRQ